MATRIKATNLKLTADIKEYIYKKLEMLAKYMNGLKVENIDFEVEKITNRHESGEIFRAEANLNVKGGLLRVEKTAKDIFKAIDKVKDHLPRIILKHKEKNLKK